jgi:hypothetical protein
MTWEEFYDRMGLPVTRSVLALDALEEREALAERTPGARTFTLTEHPTSDHIWLRCYRFNQHSGGVSYEPTNPRLRAEVERLQRAGWVASADWKTAELLRKIGASDASDRP